ncbi:MAG: L-histidine N(alpha)-methyltransferase [Acidimicrobiales bacterium]
MYDDRGSELFDQITRLEEYYPTEAERSILERESATIANITGADTIIELGSGTSDKTHTLIRSFRSTGQLKRFVPFDVSEQTLRDAASALAEQYPGLCLHGIVGDFSLHLSKLPTEGRPMVAFLGSTIGNLYVDERRAFLEMLAEALPTGGWLLLGVDLVKPADRLVSAYDDPQGVTAEFTRNLLAVVNHRLGADFQLDGFDHVALWDPSQERMDLRLRANVDHHVTIPGAAMELDIRSGEEIRAEVSTKFRIPKITAEVDDAGFTVRQVWTDQPGDVAVILASVDGPDVAIGR